MKTYRVTVQEVWLQEVIISANSEEEAMDLIDFGHGEFVDNTLTFDYRLDHDCWTA